jgi:4-amino-4-deoxy-L-arabinose transferase-like glycosyltransferase
VGSGLVLFIASFLFRFFYIVVFLEPEQYVKNLGLQSDYRALGFLSGNGVYHAQAWSSFYLFDAFVYKILAAFKIFPVFGGDGLLDQRVWAVVLVNIFFGSLSVLFFYRLSQKILSKKASFAASLFLSAYYPLVYLNSLNVPESLFSFLIIAALLILSEKKPADKKYFILGAILGFSYAVKPIIFCFVVLTVLYIFFSDRQKTAGIKKSVLMLFSFAIVVVSISGINYRVGNPKIFGVESNKAVNFAMAQCEIKKAKYAKNKDTFWFSPPAFWGSEKPEKTFDQPFSNELYYYQIGLNCIQKNPWQILRNFQHVANVFDSVFYPEFPNSYQHYVLLAFSKSLNIIFFLFFLIYPFWENDGEKRRIYKLHLLLLLGLFASVYIASPGEERYLVPFFFALLLFGTAGGLKFKEKMASV